MLEFKFMASVACDFDGDPVLIAHTPGSSFSTPGAIEPSRFREKLLFVSSQNYIES